MGTSDDWSDLIHFDFYKQKQKTSNNSKNGFSVSVSLSFSPLFLL